MKQKSKQSWIYKVTVASKPASQLLMSRFNSNVGDYNSLVLSVGEALIRFSKISSATVKLKQIETESTIKRISIDSDLYPALSQFLVKSAWGSKEKALSIIMAEAVQTINVSDETELENLIQIASCEWEELTEFSLPTSFTDSKESNALADSAKQEVAALDVSVNEIEVDEGILEELVADFDGDFEGLFTEPDEFRV